MGIKKHSKNLFDMEYVYKKLFSSSSQPTKDGDTYTLSALSSWSKTYFYFDEPKTITVSGIINDPNKTEQGLVFYNDTTELGSFTGTTRTFENVTKFRFKYLRYGKCYWSNIQIEEGTEATPYQPMMVEAENIVRTTRNLFDRNSKMNVVGSVLTSDMTFPNGYTKNARTYFIKCKPNAFYTISMQTPGDRLFIYSLNRIVDPTGYTSLNRLTFDSVLTEHMSDIPLSSTVQAPSNAKMLAFYTSTANSPNVATGVQIEEGTEATPYVPHTIEAMKVVRTTRNLFDKDRINLKNDDFLREDGSIETQAGVVAYTLDHIPVNGDFVTLSSASGTNLGSGAICLYDGEKNFIRGKAYNNNTTNTPVTFDISGGSYVRFSLRQTASKVQLEIGTIATPYVPHTITIWENNET